VKHNQRLDYARLAEVLADRGLVEPNALREALKFSGQGNLPFPEALVTANLVPDWELSRVVSELYNLPFLTVDVIQPDTAAMKGIDPQLLVENCLVPLGRFGQVLTICMPAIVPADVLGLLAAQTDLYILPVVGTVRTNRKWLEMNVKLEPIAPIPSPPSGNTQGHGGGEWGSIFDAGDAAVLFDLQQPGTDSKDA
jgi:Type II secretion system (T2SS), protein E, N-terminal domain